MTIDERLERLTERHEALTQSVEMMNHQIGELVAKSKQDTETIRQLVRAVEQDGENIRGLARIAEIHERRLSSLEGGDRES
ncbi:MAG: hypothetical protein JO211_04260 [Acidobacteriaceae bacterium]|nr:hypothetical protein [Acidobacteriaceae bacterium]